jgi:hypothetical protein
MCFSLSEWSDVSEHKVLFQAWNNKDMGMTKNLFVSLCMYSNGLKIERCVRTWKMIQGFGWL